MTRVIVILLPEYDQRLRDVASVGRIFTDIETVISGVLEGRLNRDKAITTLKDFQTIRYPLENLHRAYVNSDGSEAYYPTKVIEYINHQVKLDDGRKLRLAPIEAKMLEALDCSKPISYVDICKSIWGDSDKRICSLRTWLSHLRKKIPGVIVTVDRYGLLLNELVWRVEYK